MFSTTVAKKNNCKSAIDMRFGNRKSENTLPDLTSPEVRRRSSKEMEREVVDIFYSNMNIFKHNQSKSVPKQYSFADNVSSRQNLRISHNNNPIRQIF